MGKTDPIVQTVRERNDIVSMISSYLALKKTGQNYTGLCPFHQEKTASFSVSPTKQVFHCFGCGLGGDIYQFLMQIEGISFPQALSRLAERAGIPIPSRPPKGLSAEATAERDILLRIHQAAAAYFHRNLIERPEAEGARGHLADRGIHKEAMEAFELGYALPCWDGLLRHMGQKFSMRLLQRSGLLIPGDRQGYYDRFRGRLMFPIRNLQGEVIAFGGRTLGEEHPKYLNSPETPIYSKGRQLYGLDRARSTRERSLIVVEGYFDAIAAHQAGIPNVVATLGTALTAEHLHLLKRFCDKVVLIFDPDTAGIRAAVRAAGLFADASLPAEAVLLPEGEDPDLFLRKRGPEAFQKILREGVRLMEFAVNHLTESARNGSIDQKIRAVGEVIPLMQRVQNHLEKSHDLQRLAERLNLSEEALRKEFTRLGRGVLPKDRPLAASRSDPPPKEEQILVHLLLHRSQEGGHPSDIGPEDFTDPRTRRIARHLWDGDVSAPEPDEEGYTLYTELLVRPVDYEDPKQTLDDCRSILKKRHLKREVHRIGGEIQRAERAGNWDQVRVLQKQIYTIQQQIAT